MALPVGSVVLVPVGAVVLDSVPVLLVEDEPSEEESVEDGAVLDPEAGVVPVGDGLGRVFPVTARSATCPTVVEP